MDPLTAGLHEGVERGGLLYLSYAYNIRCYFHPSYPHKKKEVREKKKRKEKKKDRNSMPGGYCRTVVSDLPRWVGGVILELVGA